MGLQAFIAEQLAIIADDNIGRSYEEIAYAGDLEINAPGFTSINTVPECQLLAIAGEYGVEPWAA